MHIINSIDSNVYTVISTNKREALMGTTTDDEILVSATVSSPLRRQITGHSALMVDMPFSSAEAETCTSVQDVQRENIIPIPTSALSPNTLEQYRLHLYNYSLGIDQFCCSQYRSSTSVSPLASYLNDAGSAKNNYYSVGISNVGGERPYTPVGMLCNNRLALSMPLFPQRIFHSEEPKPQYSYIGLIAMAILSSAETKLVLSDIYQYILDNYPYFRARGPGWRNSIRHNLSLNDCFIKSGRSANGKGHYWAIHPANIGDFRKGDFRRRKAQRKVRKHMGLPLDTTDTDSPSPPPPPIDLTSPPPTLTPARLLHLAPKTGSALVTSHEFPLAPNGISLNCIQRNHLLHPSLLSFQYPEHRHQIHDSYLGAAIMEHTVSGLSLEQCNSNQTNKFFNSHAHSNALLLLTQQKTSENVDSHETSKHICYNRTAANNASHIKSSLADLCSQTRKRQFDVASLLAPDRKDFGIKITSTDRLTSAAGTTTFKQKKKSNLVSDTAPQSEQHHTSHPSPQLLHRLVITSSPVQQQIELTSEEQEEEEIVDVVASDIEDQNEQKLLTMLIDKESDDDDNKIGVGEGNQTFFVHNKSSECCKDLHNCRDESFTKIPNLTQNQSTDIPLIASNTTTSQPNFQLCYATKFISPSSTTHLTPKLSKAIKTSSMTDFVTSENRNGSVNQMKLRTHLHGGHSIIANTITHRNQHVRRLIHHVHQQTENGEKLDGDALGHYYGTYMAAAAARLETMQLGQLPQQQLSIKFQRK